MPGGPIPNDAVNAKLYRSTDGKILKISLFRDVQTGNVITEFNPGGMDVKDREEAIEECVKFTRRQGLDVFYLTDQTTSPEVTTRMRIED
jgi:hypothetical protein